MSGMADWLNRADDDGIDLYKDDLSDRDQLAMLLRVHAQRGWLRTADAIIEAGWVYSPDGRITEEQARRIIEAGWRPPWSCGTGQPRIEAKAVECAGCIAAARERDAALDQLEAINAFCVCGDLD